MDLRCPNEGKREKDWSDRAWAANRLENMAKNNFCAPGPARTLTIEDFVELQHRAEQLRAAKAIVYGDETRQPPDRAPVQALGEGTRVRLRGFILEAHEARPNFILRGGESCNCLRRGETWNDIHINIVESRGAAACDGIIVEMSPHFRPRLWDPARLQMASAHPVVVEGQLFFDSEHEPCGEKGLGDPKRASLWEIHPVYELLVCKHQSLDQCPIEDENAWAPLASWAGE